ncbi:hypothetical protein Plhal304r1_c034g0106211 [Plasmopara halstedii]
MQSMQNHLWTSTPKTREQCLILRNLSYNIQFQCSTGLQKKVWTGQLLAKSIESFAYISRSFVNHLVHIRLGQKRRISPS